MDNASSIKQPKRRQTLLDNKDKALISKKLVTLKKDVPVKDSLDDFALKPIDADKILTFLKEMEFGRLFKKLESDYGKFSGEITFTKSSEPAELIFTYQTLKVFKKNIL